MSEGFRYEDLKEGEFRLLAVKSIGGLLACTLNHASVEDAPPYDALSYVWGTQSETSAVLCNGAEFSLTPSLFEALGQICRYQSQINSSRMIWVDAVCIDQRNDREKGSQVRLMEKIYRSAQTVLVWLGNAHDNSDMAMERAPDLQKKLLSVGEAIHFDHLPSYGLEDQNHPIWPSYGHLLRRSWFERLWVVQEAVLAKKLMVLCGSKWLEWETLSGLNTAILQTGLLHLALKDHEIKLNTDDGFYSIPYINIHREKISANGFLLFGPLISSSRSRKCTEPVDRLWAMLGLADPQIRNDPSSWVNIDYSLEGTQHFSEPYISFAKWHIENNDPSLMLLCEAFSEEKPGDMPSWCPNWNSTQGYMNFSGVCSYQAGERSDIPAHVRMNPGSNNVQIAGFCVDKVAAVVSSSWTFSQFPDQQKGPNGFAAKLLDWESQCLSLSQVTYQEPDDVPEGHWRTLIANKLDDECQTPCIEDISEDYLNMKRYLISLREEKNFDGDKEKKAALVYYFSAMRSACQGRRFFSTRGGRVGLGPPQLQAGDTVCVFHSAGPLFTLRFVEGDDVAELIGDTYVHGLMNHEAFTTSTREEDRMFVIG